MGPTGAIGPTGPAGTSAITAVTGGTGITVTNGTGPTATVAVADASATAAGVVNTTAQAYAGVKTFNAGITIGSTGNAISAFNTGSYAVALGANLAAGANTTVTVSSVTGAVSTSILFCNPPAGFTTGVFSMCAPTATAGQVQVRLYNGSGAQINSGTSWNFLITVINP
jgi:hypothetical protein